MKYYPTFFQHLKKQFLNDKKLLKDTGGIDKAIGGLLYLGAHTIGFPLMFCIYIWEWLRSRQLQTQAFIDQL